MASVFNFILAYSKEKEKLIDIIRQLNYNNSNNVGFLNSTNEEEP